MVLKVSELFVSIQGESTWAGLPCAFVRLAGCNLRCAYCDSAWTWNDAGKAMPGETIMAWIQSQTCRMVEFTGGEPLLQPECLELMAELRRDGRRVLLETNGSLDIGPVPADVWIVMDIKTPASGMGRAMDPDNVSRLLARVEQGWGGEVKFVLASPADVDWALKQVLALDLQDHLPVLFSPVTGQLDPAWLAARILESGLEIRLQMQLHRLLWPEDTRGR